MVMVAQNGQRHRKLGEAYDGVGRLSLGVSSDRRSGRYGASGRVARTQHGQGVWSSALLRQFGFSPPMWLQEHAIDLLQVDDFGSVADCLEQGAKAQVLEAAEHAFRRAHDERERVVGKRGVRERDLVELGADEVAEAIGGHFLHQNRK